MKIFKSIEEVREHYSPGKQLMEIKNPSIFGQAMAIDGFIYAHQQMKFKHSKQRIKELKKELIELIQQDNREQEHKSIFRFR